MPLSQESLVKKRITRIEPLQAAKVVAVVYLGISIPFLPLFLLPAVVTNRPGFPVGFVLLMPFLYAFFGFIFTAFGAWVYNVAAGHVGGIEYTTVDVPDEPITAHA